MANHASVLDLIRNQPPAQSRRGERVDGEHLNLFLTRYHPPDALVFIIHTLTVVQNSPNTRLLLHPGKIAMENVDSNLRARCDFWHDISEELVT